MEFRLDKGTGYMYSYQPTHPCANSAGKVMEHVYVVWLNTGKMPSKDECIHHKDRDKTNNELSNLLLMTQSDHTRLHQIEDRGGSSINEISCAGCRKNFTPLSNRVKFCSKDCHSKQTRKFETPKDELERLVWSIPTTKVAELLGVSGVAVAKRCKLLGISKPPRGYWAKVGNSKT